MTHPRATLKMSVATESVPAGEECLAGYAAHGWAVVEGVFPEELMTRTAVSNTDSPTSFFFKKLMDTNTIEWEWCPTATLFGVEDMLRFVSAQTLPMRPDVRGVHGAPEEHCEAFVSEQQHEQQHTKYKKSSQDPCPNPTPPLSIRPHPVCLEHRT
jgi:hypothetical protein